MISFKKFVRKSDRIIDLAELTHMIGISKSHLSRLEKNGQFPQRIKIGQRRIGWSFNEFNEWLEERKNNRIFNNNSIEV
ncbi:MAG: prophage regulatory protein [Alphaproteobacteria bacterium]|jgi:prophage regulatory protein